MSEIPVHSRPRRLVDWINPTGARKVHSLVDKVYKRKNLEMAWEKVKANRGSGGVDGQNLETFEVQLEQQLERLHRELKEDTYQPLPVRQHRIPKQGKPGEFRMLGIPAIYDRVCQQALLNRLEPIFEPIFDDASFGYRRGRSPKSALRKVWQEIDSGREWIVDGDLQDFFGSVDHEKLLRPAIALARRSAPSRSSGPGENDRRKPHRPQETRLRRSAREPTFPSYRHPAWSPTRRRCSFSHVPGWRGDIPLLSWLVFLQSLRRWLTRDSVWSSYSPSAQILPQRSVDAEGFAVTSTRIDCAALPDSMTSQLTHHPI
jgi:hypothetical protein